MIVIHFKDMRSRHHRISSGKCMFTEHVQVDFIFSRLVSCFSLLRTLTRVRLMVTRWLSISMIIQQS